MAESNWSFEAGDKAVRKIVLTVHLLLVSLWTGGLAALLFLNVLRNAGLPHATDRIIFLINDWWVSNAGLLVLFTAILFAMYTRWGLLRYRWLILKWLLVLGLAWMQMFLLTPAVNSLAAFSDIFSSAAFSMESYRECIRSVNWSGAGMLALLLISITVSVYKPWGRRNTRYHPGRKTINLTGWALVVLLSGATAFQYLQLQRYRTMSIEPVRIADLTDGRHIGSVELGRTCKARVLVSNGCIQSIDLDYSGGGLYVSLAGLIKYRVIAAQRVDVDAVTGATTTSKIMLKAIEKALNREYPEN